MEWQCLYRLPVCYIYDTPSNNRVWSQDLAEFNCRLQLSIFRELLQLGEFLQRVEMGWMSSKTATMEIWFKILQSKCWWYIIKVKSLNTKNSFKYDFHQLDSKTPPLLAGNCFCSEGRGWGLQSQRDARNVSDNCRLFLLAITHPFSYQNYQFNSLWLSLHCALTDLNYLENKWTMES